MGTVAVALGGLLGAVARYWLATAIGGGAFPVGILVVNIVGSFVLGVIMSVATTHGPLRPEALLFWTVGLCGGFTTMSAFSYDTVVLVQDGRGTLALLNVAVTIAACLAAIWFGQATGRLL